MNHVRLFCNLVATIAVAFGTMLPARATVFYDSSFIQGNWSPFDLSTTASTATFATVPSGGLGPAPYSKATTAVGTSPGGSTSFGVQIYTAGSFSGIISSIDFSINFQGLSFPSGGSGQAFGPMLEQGGILFRATALRSYVTGTSISGWQQIPPANNLQAADFVQVTGPYTVNVNVHPDFNDPRAVTHCGFFVGNSGTGAYTNVAGYDEWTCEIKGPVQEMGILQICKIAGSGVAPGTSFPFTVGTQPMNVPAGIAPNGTCQSQAQVPLGTIQTVQELIPQGYGVSSITAVPSNALNSVNLATGSASITVTAPVTQIFYTDYSIPQGILKICKVAGPGVAIGSSVGFTVGSTPLSVLAGPAPGGYCAVGPNLPVGAIVNLQETIPPGSWVGSIAAGAPNQLSNVNIAAGSATVQIGAGVTEVTFTNNSLEMRRLGYLEICKIGGIPGQIYSFNLSGGGNGSIGPITAPSGGCSPAISLLPGLILVTEAPGPYASIIGSTTVPASRQGPWNSTSSTVTVVPGNISTQTIVTIKNRPMKQVKPQENMRKAPSKGV